jgi:hypothetical protein
MVRQQGRGRCQSYQEDRIDCESAYGRWILFPSTLTATAAAAPGGGQGQGGGGPRSGGSDGGVVGQVATKTLSSQIFHLQQIVGDMQNKAISLISDQRKHVECERETYSIGIWHAWSCSCTTDKYSRGTTSIKMPEGFAGAVEGWGSGTWWGEASKGILLC